MKQQLLIRLAAYPEVDSISNGPGLRTVLWTQGCPHNCPGCHNPETHNRKGGKMVTARWITSKIPLYQDGITFSGGDPMCQPLSLIPVAIWAHKHSQDVWCYTGYRYETLLKSPTHRAFLDHIDVLVDGPYVRSLPSAPWRGSNNQRIIDVQKSLKGGEIVLWMKDQVKAFPLKESAE